jgi:hypothetical protein
VVMNCCELHLTLFFSPNWRQKVFGSLIALASRFMAK